MGRNWFSVLFAFCFKEILFLEIDTMSSPRHIIHESRKLELKVKSVENQIHKTVFFLVFWGGFLHKMLPRYLKIQGIMGWDQHPNFTGSVILDKATVNSISAQLMLRS